MLRRRLSHSPVIRGFVLRAAALVCGMAVTAAAAEPVALVLETAGVITPPLEAFSEIEANNTVELGEASNLVFLHYPTCQKVVVQGGRLNLSAENFRVSKGKVIDISRAECPQRVQLAADGGAGIGGVVLRGADEGALKVSRRPGFKLLGGGVARYKHLQLLQGEVALFEAPAGSAAVLWPDALPDLQAGGDYTLLLMGPGGASAKVKLEVTNKSRQQAPAIIRVD